MLKSNDKNFIIANVKDKIALAKKRNKIQHTQFFTKLEKALIEKELKRSKRRKNFFLWRI